MRCQRAQKWMTAAVDGELSARRRRARWLPLPAFALATAAVLVLAIGIVRRTGQVPSAPAVRAPRVDARGVAQAPPSLLRPPRRFAEAPPAEPPAKLAEAPDLFVD